MANSLSKGKCITFFSLPICFTLNIYETSPIIPKFITVFTIIASIYEYNQGEALWIVPKVLDFLAEQGRMKFVRPLYRALAGLKQGPDLARETFSKLHSLYHPIARKMVASDLGVAL